MIHQDTHFKQEVDTLELLAFLDENQEEIPWYKMAWLWFISLFGFKRKPTLIGLAKVEIRVLNGWKLDALNTFGRPHSDFACLRDCVKERLVQAGYDMRNFDYGNLL